MSSIPDASRGIEAERANASSKVEVRSARVPDASKRRAATLVELIMGIVVATMVILLAASQVTRHQRAYDAIAAELDLRVRLGDASDILAADLRGLSPVGDTLLVASDTAVEFYSALGASTLCALTAPNQLTLPPDTLATGRTLSSWVATPDTGDYVLVFADSSSTSPGGWQRARIVSFGPTPTALGCPLSAGLLSASDAAGAPRSYEASFTPALSATVRRGAPVRFIRRVRYSVYRAGDGKWYLGYHRCSVTCAAIQPVSGPYESDHGPPISLRYFTSNGAPLAGIGPTTDVARIEIVSRGTYTRPVRMPGLGLRTADSAVVTVALRNLWR